MRHATVKRSKRGRPTKNEALKRQDEFLDHCIAMFMKRGYRNVSVDALALSFGVSKSTIYLHYGSKAGLVRAAMERAMPQLREPLARVSTDRARPPRTVLRDYARIIQRYSNEPNIRALWRAVSEARDDLGDDLDVVAVETREVVQPIAAYLGQLKSAGLVKTTDESATAVYFSEIVSGGVSRFLGNALPEDERRRSLDSALAFFCRGIGLKEG